MGDAVAGTLAALSILLGLGVMSVAVLGMLRLDDFFLRLHAASKAVALGVVLLLLAAIPIGEGAITSRAMLTALFLLVTAPVSAHVIGRAGSRHEPRADPPPADSAKSIRRRDDDERR